MSINTTSTSDRIATDSSTSEAPETGTRGYEGISALMSAVPDPAAIAKLANEFFAALSGGASPADPAISSPATNHADTIPSAPPAAVPDFPRAMFSFPAVPNAGAVSGAPQPSTGPLTEADFRAIAASLSGATLNGVMHT